MWVHWTKKIMRFMHKGSRITLRGVRPEMTKCSAISPGRLKGLLRRQAVTHYVQFKPCAISQSGSVSEVPQVCAIQQQDIPVQIQHLLGKYEDVFREPVELPPKRPYGHQITFVPGAQPVNVRPYHYAPVEKTN